MSHQFPERNVYYYIMEGSRYLFADERDKKHLLDLVHDIQRKDNWLIYAFCVIDDSAYFIIEAECMDGISRALQTAAQRLAEAPAGRRSMNAGKTHVSVRGKKLDTLAEIAGYCRRIHRLPLEHGYVHRIGDYWWSSYPTYLGNYEWEQVDRRVLSMFFSADPNKARKRLVQFHRSDINASVNINVASAKM